MSAPSRAQPAAALDFQHVFSEHCKFVWRVLARLGVHQSDLPDVCQEVFLVVHRQLGNFDPTRAALSSWMYGICLRSASDYRRRRVRRKETSAEAAPVVARAEHQFEDLAQRRAWHRLEAVLDAMDAGKRAAFVLYELENLPMSQVAAILSCPLQTAYARLHAARRLVFQAFEEKSES
ncbi:MAG TPA: sigma-70 family RNA polymerase sigma factor [Polyangiaceae bacterium]|nr:sigma-70 family RNA polymerase sigma factor [Polyangiaceae bacterium]